MAAIDKLLQKWNARFPHPKRDPVSVWDDIVTNRSVQEFRKWTIEVHSACAHLCSVQYVSTRPKTLTLTHHITLCTLPPTTHPSSLPPTTHTHFPSLPPITHPSPLPTLSQMCANGENAPEMPELSHRCLNVIPGVNGGGIWLLLPYAAAA